MLFQLIKEIQAKGEDLFVFYELCLEFSFIYFRKLIIPIGLGNPYPNRFGNNLDLYTTYVVKDSKAL